METTQHQAAGKKRVSIGGAEAFDATVQLNRKIKMVKFEPSHCYYRTLLKAYKAMVQTPDGPQPDYKLGLPSHWMFQEMLGVPVVDPYLGNEHGFVVANKYAIDNAFDYIAKAAVFTVPETQYDKQAYANFIRTLYKFAKGYKNEDDEDRPIIFFTSAMKIEPTPEQLEDPNFDADMFVIEGFKEIAGSTVAGTENTGMEIAKMTAEKCIARWSLDNTDIKMAYTYTCNANFDGVKYWGSIEPAENDEGFQLAQATALGSYGRFLAQHNFIASGASGGADPQSQTFYDAFNKWLSAPKSNNKIMDVPSPNGVTFVLSMECSTDGKKLVIPDGATEPKLEIGIMGWSSKKTEKVKAEKLTGIVYTDPDVCHAVLKFNVGSDASQAGKDMSVASWDNVKKKMPYEKIVTFANETFQPTIGDRINNYQPFNLQGCIASFKKFELKMKPDEWMTEEEKERYQKARAILAAKTTAEDIAQAINGTMATTTATVGGVNMIGGIALTDEAPSPAPQVTPNPAPQATPNPAPQVTPEVQPQVAPAMVTPNPEPAPNPAPAPAPVM